jgi:integrase
MISQGNSYTTVGIYLRNLRAIFKEAISESEVDQDIYPFGENKYVIPEGQGTKRAFDKGELKKLFAFELPDDSPIIKARAFWFFSYMANGMNVRDICELRISNFTNDRFKFIRTKTKRTTKKNIKNIDVIVTPLLKEIINRYGTKSKNPNTYIFPIFNNTMTAVEKVRACEKFTRYINQHMKILARLVGVDPGISTYYARHSFSNISVNHGSSLEFVQEALGHQSITTTQAYFAGFNDEKKFKNANALMDFDMDNHKNG